MLIDLMSTAKPPWMTPDSVSDVWRRAGLPYATNKEIAKCLNCQLPECIDCLGGGTGRPVGRPRKTAISLEGQVSMDDLIG